MTTNPAVEIDLDKQRAEFEATFKLDQWQKRPHPSIEGDYADQPTQCAWTGWQLACRAQARASQAVAEPVALPWADVVAAIRAVDKEAARRGEMYPQHADDQRDDRRAASRTIEIIEWYATKGGSVAERLEGWPKIAAPVAQQSEACACTVPPDGSACTRAPGHEGPCAAVPVTEDGYTEKEEAAYQRGLEDGKCIERGIKRYHLGIASQPEGEAPQAVSRRPPAPGFERYRDLGIGPAAQHAESGAQAASADERADFDAWLVRERKPYCEAPANEIHQWIGWQARAALAAPVAQQSEAGAPKLTVWEGPMPESNGRQNYTAILTRKDAEGFDMFTDGICFQRCEYPDRVRYEADCMRYLIGERDTKPEMWGKGYDFNKHSGYVEPVEAGAPTAAAELTPLDYRAQGREEVLEIILGQSAEDPFARCIGWSHSGAPDDEGGCYWKEDELRELLHIGDRKHDAYDRAEVAYWEALGRSDEAKREMLLVEQAPFYKPLHDFLSKHEAWDLMADLKTAQAGRESAAPVAQQDAKDAARYRWLRDEARDVGDPDSAPIVVMMDWTGKVIRGGSEDDGIRSGEDLDKEMDAAMQKGAQEK